jgi:hypothetical protein
VQRSGITRYQIVKARPVAERIVRCSSTLVAPHNLLVPFLFYFWTLPTPPAAPYVLPSFAASSVEPRAATIAEAAFVPATATLANMASAEHSASLSSRKWRSLLSVGAANISASSTPQISLSASGRTALRSNCASTCAAAAAAAAFRTCANPLGERQQRLNLSSVTYNQWRVALAGGNSLQFIYLTTSVWLTLEESQLVSINDGLGSRVILRKSV